MAPESDIVARGRRTRQEADDSALRAQLLNRSCQHSFKSTNQRVTDSRRSFQLSVSPNEIVRRTVVLQLRGRFAFQLGNDALGKRLPEFNTPLVEGIDIPNHTLSEDVVLVESDQLSKHCRR